MKPKPVKRYRIPSYPTKLQVLAHRDLLEKHWPQAWRKNAEMAGVAALLLAANGCHEASDGVSAAGPDVATVASEQTSAPLEGPSKFVAPIFHHGEGRGTTGCMGVSPPVFLSEEEALQVIVEELSRAGVNISQTNVTMEKLAVEQEFRRMDSLDSASAEEFAARFEAGGPESPGVVKPLEVDGLSDDGAVAFEYVSGSDYTDFGGVGYRSSVRNYDMPGVAQSLAERVAETEVAIHFGTFYEPLTFPDLSTASGEYTNIDLLAFWQEREIEAKQMSKQRLREQAADFVNWLKAQGAI